MPNIFVYEYVCAQTQGSVPQSLLAEGRAMRDAICTDLRALPDVKVLSLESESEMEFRRLAAEADWSLIIAPEFEGILEERCRWVEQAGGRLLGPSSSAVRITADKLRLATIFGSAGIATPETWPLGDEPQKRFPVVWKPRFGAGSQWTFLIREPADRRWAKAVLADERASPEMLAQAHVDGIAASVAYLIGPRAILPMMPCRQDLSDDGRFTYLGGSLPLPGADDAIAAGMSAVRCVDGLRGYVGVDMVIGEKVWVIEINPRLTTSIVGLRALAEFNIAEAMLAMVRGDLPPEMHWKSGSVRFTPSSAGPAF